jgi:hypothetical protein
VNGKWIDGIWLNFLSVKMFICFNREVPSFYKKMVHNNHLRLNPTFDFWDVHYLSLGTKLYWVCQNNKMICWVLRTLGSIMNVSERKIEQLDIFELFFPIKLNQIITASLIKPKIIVMQFQNEKFFNKYKLSFPIQPCLYK